MSATTGSFNRIGGSLSNIKFQRGLVFGVIIIAALLSFELFNYSTTDYALKDLLGDLDFLGIRWATILAIAFCGIDFAGIARLFTPEDNHGDPGEVWYLFGAWLLAATMNAMLTWWGVSLAILNHQTLGNAVIPRETLLRIVPIFVAVLVWLIRVLIIGTFSVAGERIFTLGDRTTRTIHIGLNNPSNSMPIRSLGNRPTITNSVQAAPVFRPTPKHVQTGEASRSEPSYHPVSMSGAPQKTAVQKPLTPFSSRQAD